MTTAGDLVTQALTDIRVIGEGETPNASQSSSALDVLNGILESWAVEGLLIETNVFSVIAASGASSYTLGSGGTWDTDTIADNAYPMYIDAIQYVDTSGNWYPIKSIPIDQYNVIPDKVEVGQPTVYSIVYNYSNKLHRIFFYPYPSSGFLYATLRCTIQASNLNKALVSTDTLFTPIGYNRALRLALATELMPMYGKANQQIAAMAQKAKLDIMRMNSSHRPIIASLDLPNSTRRTSNILLG